MRSVPTSPSEATSAAGSEISVGRLRVASAAAVFLTSSVSAWLAGADTHVLRIVIVASAYLSLALTEVVPPFVPTLVLLSGVPLLLGSIDAKYSLTQVLTWPADPVLALFAGGLALGLAAHRHGVDVAIAGFLLRAARGERRRLLGYVLLGTAAMSMWISNIAAAALLLAALHPILNERSVGESFRRALLLSVAVGANLGGMATPLGSGPNAIAIRAASHLQAITFLDWMSFGVPLVLGTLTLAYVLLVKRYGVEGSCTFDAPAVEIPRGKAARVVVVFGVAVAAWLSEPLHGLPAPLIALLVTFVLFAFGMLGKEDLGALDWSTLGLIAGGVSLGKLFESSGLLSGYAHALELSQYPRAVWTGAFTALCATLAAIMSNTGTAALLIPLGMAIEPAPSTAIIIAMAASFGMPFSISTPPNAMVYGTGTLRASDLLFVGLPLMIIGCVLITLTGPWFLALLGLD